MEILGIDIGGSGIKGALVDVADGALASDRHRIDTPKPATPNAVAKTVARMAKHFDWKGPIGCAFPARVKHGVSLTASNIDQQWIGCNAAQLFRDRTGCPTAVLNDADAAGMAEMAFGAGRTLGKGTGDLVLLLTVGTGIGSALFTDGTLVPNTELGHLLLNGMKAEHYASDRVRKAEGLGWKEWADRFQEYLAHVEFLFAPDLIILGGGVSRPKKWDRYADRLRTEARIVPAELQNEAGIVGAAYTAHTVL